MKKIYISKTGIVYAFPVTIKKGDKELHPFIQFGNDLKFETSTEDVQKSIEASDYFKSGKIALLSSEESEDEGSTKKEVKDESKVKSNKGKTPNKAKSEHEPKAYDNVTDIQSAVDVLKSEPYNIDVKLLRTPEAITKQATACNITFPNWN